MSLAAKQQLVRGISGRLADMVTAAQRDAILAMMTEELEGFEVEAVAGSGAAISMDLLDEFLSAKTIEGKSPRTVERYRYTLTRILTEIGVPVSRITVYHLRAYMMQERNRGISDSTLEGYRSIMRSMFTWLHREGLIPSDPTANLGTVKCPKVMRLPYSDVEVERLKAACTTTRDRALVCFLLSTGCRVSEVVGLDRNAINWQEMSCRVFGKGSKERTVYLDSVTAMYLRQYLAERCDDDPALFYSRNHGRLTVNGVQRMLKTLEASTGIPNVHPHRFRRTLATNLIGRGMPIQEVAFILGHEKLDTTMKYVYIDARDVRTAYQKYS